LREAVRIELLKYATWDKNARQAVDEFKMWLVPDDWSKVTGEEGYDY